jgi:hypothetical protein
LILVVFEKKIIHDNLGDSHELDEQGEGCRAEQLAVVRVITENYSRLLSLHCPCTDHHRAIVHCFGPVGKIATKGDAKHNPIVATILRSSSECVTGTDTTNTPFYF